MMSSFMPCRVDNQFGESGLGEQFSRNSYPTIDNGLPIANIFFNLTAPSKMNLPLKLLWQAERTPYLSCVFFY